MTPKKKKSKMERITKAVVWLMLIAMFASAVIITGITLFSYFNR